MQWNSPYYLPAVYTLNIPSFYSITVPTGKQEEQAKAVQPECAKKPAKEAKLIKEAALITMEEFESVPA